jgi:hypothetical protein
LRRYRVLVLVLSLLGSLFLAAPIAANIEVVIVASDGMWSGPAFPGIVISTDSSNDGAHPVEVVLRPNLRGTAQLSVEWVSDPVDDLWAGKLTFYGLPVVAAPDAHHAEIHIDPWALPPSAFREFPYPWEISDSPEAQAAYNEFMSKHFLPLFNGAPLSRTESPGGNPSTRNLRAFSEEAFLEGYSVSERGDLVVSVLFTTNGRWKFRWIEETCNGLSATIVGDDGDNVIDGTSGDDVIWAGAGDDIVRGRGGNDTICLGDGNDTGYGGAGRDTILGGKGADVLDGGGKKDKLFGGGGDDDLVGGGGNDVLKGNKGDDTGNGGPGDDTCRVEAATNCER